MEINESMIDKLASLSKLSFSNVEKAELIADLNRMLEFVNQLQALDTKNRVPLLHITPARNLLRDDKVGDQLSAEEALSNAKLKNESYFKVPKVISKS